MSQHSGLRLRDLNTGDHTRNVSPQFPQQLCKRKLYEGSSKIEQPCHEQLQATFSRAARCYRNGQELCCTTTTSKACKGYQKDHQWGTGVLFT